jgi:hypothetical protein
MSAVPLTAVLALSALVLTTADQDWYWMSWRARVRRKWGLWLGVLVLLALAAASTAFGILHPEMVAASFG